MAEKQQKDQQDDDNDDAKQVKGDDEAKLDDGGGGDEAKDGMPAPKAAPGGDDDGPTASAAKAEHGAHGRSLGKFQITHYTFALESDPKHRNSPKVSAPGLPPGKKYRQSFLGSPYGIKMQGTGLAEDGQYIMYLGGGRYKYGVGGAGGRPEAWKTVAVDPRVIKMQSKLHIDIYKDKGDFIAKDTGGAIKGKHIDVFAGPVPISVAYSLGTKYSTVRLLDKNDDFHDDDDKKGGAKDNGTGGAKAPANKKDDEDKDGNKKDGHHISASVGRGGKNREADVRKVQTRLKQRGVDPGAIDGDCGPNTIKAIEKFQSTFWDSPDGLIEPGHGTEKRLFEDNGKVTPGNNPKDKEKGKGDRDKDKGDGGKKDSGGGKDEDDEKDKDNDKDAPPEYAQIARNFNAGIPGSSYFTWHEALYLPSWGRHCRANEVNSTILNNIVRQANALDRVRDHFGAPIVVHVWTRPTAYNKAIGGASNSAHLRGTATDFHISGKTAEQVRRVLINDPKIYPGKGELRVSWVHLDLEHKAWFNP